MEKDAASYGQAVTRFGVTRIVRRHRVRNRVERWIQELEHRIDTFYVPFKGHDVITANDWHWPIRLGLERLSKAAAPAETNLLSPTRILDFNGAVST